MPTPSLVVPDGVPVHQALQFGESSSLALETDACLSLHALMAQRLVPRLRQAQQQLLAIPDVWPSDLRVIKQVAQGARISDRVTRRCGGHPRS